jgi:hypothetical protein
MRPVKIPAGDVLQTLTSFTTWEHNFYSQKLQKKIKNHNWCRWSSRKLRQTTCLFKVEIYLLVNQKQVEVSFREIVKALDKSIQRLKMVMKRYLKRHQN